MKKLWRNLLLCLCIASLCLGLVACSKGAQESAYDDYDPITTASSDTSYMITYSSKAVSDETGETVIAEETEQTTDSSRKIIRTVYITAETKSFDKVMDSITSMVKAYGGYFEEESVNSYYKYSRYADLTIRIPKAKADEFLTGLSDNVNVLRKSETNEDVTLDYSDVESHLKALRTQEERLLELLAEADTLSDMISIEDKLTNVRYQIEAYESQRLLYDNQIDYVTIVLDLNEVESETQTEEESIWTRMGEGFVECLKGVGEFFEELLVFLVSASPVLVLLAAIAFVIVFSIRRSVRKKREKRAAKARAAVEAKETNE